MKKAYMLILALAFMAIASLHAQTKTVPPVTSASLPPELKHLASEAEIAADVLEKARIVTVYLTSNAIVGNNDSVNITLQGPATASSLVEAVNKVQAQIKLSGPEQVGMSVQLHDPNYKVSLYGFDWKTPVMGKAGYELPKFKIALQLNSEVLVPIAGISQVKMTWFNENGGIEGSSYLNMSEKSDGFYFPTSAAGKVLLELTKRDGSGVLVFDLRKGMQTAVMTLAGSADVSIENFVFISDKSELNLVPISYGGKGKNVMGVVDLTKATTVSVAAQTTEGAKAIGFKYRQAGGEWQIIKASANGIASIPLGVGKSHVLPIWDSSFVEQLYYYPPKG